MAAGKSRLTAKPVAVACDHAGHALKKAVMEELAALGYFVLDLGTHGEVSVDYPDFADHLAQALGRDEAEMGVLMCGTGVGISMAANRYRHVRAALCHSKETAALARQHNNANVLVMGGRILDEETARECVRVFFTTEFEGGRHARRVEKLS